MSRAMASRSARAPAIVTPGRSRAIADQLMLLRDPPVNGRGG
jgi:hypothetical protein